MDPTAVPTRITIDFRDAALPSRTWILGVDVAATDRMELIAIGGGPQPPEPWSRPAVRPAASTPRRPATVIECDCPAFCELDHANE